ncbi:cell division protein ZipA C-terminal FtsZ-binding domain-containing protein [uncultured Cocleimonas sp.]|uniref:cell division protein ZipA C-terminal FtsZ-binding domain-containing protein n=1 Tax=uncultured Cocleimonas sp. TaxID=1051587 RepID=UPI00262BF638|nr:cell division protein ZipA C-terminal FtsZ-binding domain-containing protein [uncultured Cocleimonas sp.]
MNITSILITIVGIIFIIALYLLSRISQSKLPNKDVSLLPDIKDDDGKPFTSILDDIPARDGIKPTKTAKTEVYYEKVKSAAADKSVLKKSVDSNSSTQSIDIQPIKQQIVLFISAHDESGLDGNLIEPALAKHGLQLGENDIYHYFDEELDSKSLFKIANGVDPWTLTSQDLSNKKLAGLSVVMLPNTKIDGKMAVSILLKTVENLANDINGVLKNDQQQLLTQQDKEFLLN